MPEQLGDGQVVVRVVIQPSDGHNVANQVGMEALPRVAYGMVRNDRAQAPWRLAVAPTRSETKGSTLRSWLSPSKVGL